MRLEELDPAARGALAGAYAAEGVVVMRGIDLPPAFEPPHSDLVFIRVGNRCEIYMGAACRYAGRDAGWVRIGRSPERPGRARQIAAVRGDFLSGYNRAVELFRRADESEPAAESPADVGLDGGAAEVARPAAAARPRQPLGRGRVRVGRLRNLVEVCRRTPPEIVGRDDLVFALKTNLIRQTKPGVVLVGKPGVGKTALVLKLADDMARGREMPPGLMDAGIHELPLGALVEDARLVGDIERRAREILEAQGRPIFFADEIHQFARQELRGLVDMLKPALAEGRIRMIGATTPKEWRSVQDGAFKRRFLEIDVEEPDAEETYRMLLTRCRGIAAHHGIEIGDEAIREAIMLAQRYLPSKCFPDKAIDLLDQAAAMQVAAGVKAGVEEAS